MSIQDNPILAGVHVPRVINRRPGGRNEEHISPTTSPVASLLSGLGNVVRGGLGMLSPSQTTRVAPPIQEEKEEEGGEGKMEEEFPGLEDDGDPDGALLVNSAVPPGNGGRNGNIFVGMEGGRPSHEGTAEYWRNRAMHLQDRVTNLEDTMGSMSRGNMGNAHLAPPSQR